MSDTSWRALEEKLRESLTPEEGRILEQLAAGKTQPEIGKALGLHRSAIWRRIRALRTRYKATGSGVAST